MFPCQVPFCFKASGSRGVDQYQGKYWRVDMVNRGMRRRMRAETAQGMSESMVRVAVDKRVDGQRKGESILVLGCEGDVPRMHTSSTSFTKKPSAANPPASMFQVITRIAEMDRGRTRGLRI